MKPSFEQLLLDFIARYIREHRHAPSQMEAAEALGVSRSKIKKTLQKLEEGGHIECERNIARGIRLTTPPQMGDMFRIPMMGVIQAGEPIPVPYNADFGSFTPEDSVDVAMSLMPAKEKGRDLFALKVQGESMVDAMINDGDIVILKAPPLAERRDKNGKKREYREAGSARNGDMVAVWLSDRNETTLKFFFKEKDRYRLQPANPTMKPIYIDKNEGLEIMGKVVMVIRRIESIPDEEPKKNSIEGDQVVKWRLDAAVPDHVQVSKAFDLGVLICPDIFPLLNVDDLPKVKSANIHPAFDDNKPYMQMRVEVQAPDCKIHGENPRLVRVSKDTYSPIYFQLTPSSTGLISILVSVFQELDMLGNTRVRTQALKEIGNVKVEVSSASLDSNVAYENAVFVSYSWGGESERVVDELEKVFTEHGLLIVRDKKDLDYKGSIKEFEQRIGRGQSVVLVISDKYLQSANCMYELVEIDENKEFRKRVFPIVLADAQIYKANDRIAYIHYWDKRIDELNKNIKTVDKLTHLNGFTDELNQFDRIRSKFDHLSQLLSDMNALTPEKHAANGFSSLISQVEAALNKEPI